MLNCRVTIVFGAIILHFVHAYDVLMRTESGVIGGARRIAERGTIYASFRGVPYGKQPLGELRFKELQPLEPFDYIYNATTEGPICPQKDHFFGTLMRPQGMSEACIHANIHVPIEDLPALGQVNDPSLPILVFIHGGAFQSGSGDADINGPEYLITKRCLVITFNYRLNVFGFMTLNSTNVPGNQGLRDALTLLKWVQRNAKFFGGNPDDVTLLGDSGGSVMAQLLSLSLAAEGLFHRLILMSGNAVPSFYMAQEYQKNVANQLLVSLGISDTDPDEIHSQLIALPLDIIMKAYYTIQDLFGLVDFAPVIESSLPNVTRILDDDPEELIKIGRGKNFPVLIGFSNAEFRSIRKRFEELNIVDNIKQDLVTLVPPNLINSLPNEIVQDVAKKIEERYFGGSITLDKYLDYISDYFFRYPAMKFTQWRVEMEGAPVFLYQLSYDADHSIIKENFGLCYEGSGHLEDLTYIFRVNTVLGKHRSLPPKNKDDSMKDWLTDIIINFMQCSDPSCYAYISGEEAWPAVSACQLVYQDIRTPGVFDTIELTQRQKEMMEFFDSIEGKTDS